MNIWKYILNIDYNIIFKLIICGYGLFFILFLFTMLKCIKYLTKAEINSAVEIDIKN